MQRPLPFGQDVRGEVVDEVAMRMPNRARAGPADPGCVYGQSVRRPHVSKNADTRLLSVEFYEKCPGAGAVTLTIEVTYTLCLS